MRITKFTLKNWGPHKHLVLDMDTPVFGLIGPNYSGKSNIMEAIEFAFTGLLAERRTQASYVRRASDEEINNASVEAEFIKGGVRGRIFRQIGKTPQKKFWWDGAKDPITSSAEIDERMSKILDCDKAAIGRAVFLSQGKIADFLSGTPAQREDSFAEICLIDKLALVVDVAEQEILRLRKTVTDLTSQRDEAMQTKEQAESALRVTESELEIHPDRTREVEWVSKRLAEEQSLLELRKVRQAAVTALELAKEQLAALHKPEHAGHASLEDLLVSLESDLLSAVKAQGEARTLEDKITNHERLAVRSIELSGMLEKAVDGVIRLAGSQGSMNRLQFEIDQTVESKNWHRRLQEAELELQRSGSDISTMGAKLQGMRTEQAISEVMAALDVATSAAGEEQARLKLVESASSQLTSCCPVCGGTDLSHVPDPATLQKRLTEIAAENAARRQQRQALQTELSELVSAKASLEGAKGAEERAKRAVEACNAQKPASFDEKHIAADVPQMRSQLASLAAEVRSLQNDAQALSSFQTELTMTKTMLLEIPDLAAAKEQLALYQSVASAARKIQEQIGEIKGYQTRASAATKRVGEAQALLENHEKTIADGAAAAVLTTRAAPLTLLATPSDILGLQEALNQLRAKQAERDKVQGMIRANTDALRRAENRVQEIDERILRNASTLSVIGYLEDLKNAFGRNGIARHYLSKVFDSLTVMTQENLATWDAQFQVEKDPDNLFNFLFYSLDAPDVLMDQKLLSGGQKTRVALSFVQAVQQLLYPGLDFLSVDEPSNHLDAEGVEGLVNLFQTVASQNMEGEAQVIVVDHNPLLMRAFSKCHVLERAYKA